MAASFFFYDLETTGFNPRRARIMQFAGQRTDLELKPIGKPVNAYIKLTPDVLPEPDAVLITGITPQKTIADGLSEAEFLKLFYNEVVKPDTIFVGYNNIRFDDEFMRFLHYRNFYDAYEWQWANGCSRWDILDVVRMVRALKPDGIKWPFAPDGKPTNRLEFLTTLNKLRHEAAHDALSDVQATIDVAQLIHNRAPDLFEYLLDIRKKDKVRAIVESGKPFMYTSGRFSSQYLHTSACIMLGRHATQDYVLVYDLRYDPESFMKMSVEELIDAWKYARDPEVLRLPVKTLKYNRSPAIVPGVVKDQETLDRLELSREMVQINLTKISKNPQPFVKKLFEAVDLMDQARERDQMTLVANELTVDERLYDGFIDKADTNAMRVVRAAEPEDLSDLGDDFQDERLKTLLPLYKARNFSKYLTSEEQAEWNKFIYQRLLAGGPESRAAKYFARLGELAETKPSPAQQFLLEELQLYGQSILPGDEAG
jgi:exodeoxyribonuclease-1